MCEAKISYSADLNAFTVIGFFFLFSFFYLEQDPDLWTPELIGIKCYK